MLLSRLLESGTHILYIFCFMVGACYKNSMTEMLQFRHIRYKRFMDNTHVILPWIVSVILSHFISGLCMCWMNPRFTYRSHTFIKVQYNIHYEVWRGIFIHTSPIDWTSLSIKMTNLQTIQTCVIYPFVNNFLRLIIQFLSSFCAGNLTIHSCSVLNS